MRIYLLNEFKNELDRENADLARKILLEEVRLHIFDACSHPTEGNEIMLSGHPINMCIPEVSYPAFNLEQLSLSDMILPAFQFEHQYLFKDPNGRSFNLIGVSHTHAIFIETKKIESKRGLFSFMRTAPQFRIATKYIRKEENEHLRRIRPCGQRWINAIPCTGVALNSGQSSITFLEQTLINAARGASSTVRTKIDNKSVELPILRCALNSLTINELFTVYELIDASGWLCML